MVSLGLIFHTVSHWHWILAFIGIICMAIALATHKKLELNPLRLSIPLGVLVLLMFISPGDTVSKLYAAGLFITYIVSKEASLKTLCVIIAVGVITLMIAHDRTGGVFYNRNIAVGALVIAPLLLVSWIVLSIALVGLYFTGAELALVGMCAIGLITLIRRDFSKKILYTVAPLLVVIAICTPIGLTEQLWHYVPLRFEQANAQNWDDALNMRIGPNVNATRDIRLFGHGYEPFNLLPKSAHNVPLRILYELGPIASLLWLTMIAYGIKKRAYIFTTILALSMLDHFMWTSLSPLCWTAWARCGKNPYLFKEVYENA